MNTLSPITSNPRYEAPNYGAELMAQIPDLYAKTFRISSSEVVPDGIMIIGAGNDLVRGNTISFRANSKTIVAFHYDEENPIWIKGMEICEVGKFTIYMDIRTSGSVPILSCVIW